MRTVSCCLVALAVVACGEVVKIQPDVPPAIAPTLTSVDPPRGIVTTRLTIAGSDLGETQGGSTITIGGTAATVETWSDTSIVATIPDVFPGEVPVIVTTDGGASDPAMVRVILPPRVYVDNGADTPTPGDGFGSITIMAFDPESATLTQAGIVSSKVTSQGFGGCVSSLVVHEKTRRLFVGGNSGVGVMAIDPVTGMLAHIPGSPFMTADAGDGIDIDADATRLWRAGLSEKQHVFQIAADGTLTPVVGSPFTATPGSDVLTASRDGTFVYANTESSKLHAFSVTANGALTPLPGSPYTTAGFSFSIARRPATDQLFITIAQTLHVYQPAPGTGVPSPIAGSPFAFTAVGGTPHFVTFTPDGNRAYIGVRAGSKIVGMNLAANGAATVMAGSPFDFTGTLSNVSCLRISADGTYMIGNDEGGKDVSVLRLSPTGVPTQVTGSPFAITIASEDSSGLAITF